jgi:large subunit ribosomal protein L10
MALTKAKKTEKVAALATELEHSTSAIIGTFSKLTASKDYALRKTIRGAGGSYHVVKNKLVARAAQGTKIEAALQGLKGVSSVAYTSGDPVALAKALSTWVKDNAEFTFKLGIVEGKVITVAGQGRALLGAPLPDSVPRAAPGYGHQRHRPRSRGGHQSGR